MRGYLAVLWLLVVAPIAFAGEQVEKAMERFEKQLEPARAQYEKVIARTIETTIPTLLAIGERNEKADPDEAKAAYLAVLKLDRQNERAREFFQKRNELEAALTRVTKSWTPMILPAMAPEWEEKAYYETMLGRFSTGPVTLVVPNGGNVLPDAVRSRLKSLTGKETADYSGQGKFYVKDAGDYLIQATSCSPSVDGASIGLTAEGGNKVVRLEAGVHSIGVFTVPGISAVRTSIAISNPRTRQRLPIFNSLADIKRRLSTPMNGQEIVDVSGWDPARVRPLSLELPER
jgi:hypothetical protein